MSVSPPFEGKRTREAAPGSNFGLRPKIRVLNFVFWEAVSPGRRRPRGAARLDELTIGSSLLSPVSLERR